MRSPKTLLLVLVGAVPLVVAATAFAAFLLVRAGFGLLVGAGVPFVFSTVLIVGLSVVLGRAASGSGGSSEDRSEGSDRRSRRRDGV